MLDSVNYGGSREGGEYIPPTFRYTGNSGLHGKIASQLKEFHTSMIVCIVLYDFEV